VVHLDALERRLVREEQPVVEGVAGVDVMPSAMCASSKETTGDRLFIGQRVDQALAQQDRVADRRRFHRGRQQNAAVNRVREVELLGTARFTTICSSVLSKSLGGASNPACTRRSSTLFSACETHCASRLQRRHILRIGALVDRAFHLHRDVLALARGQRQRIAPEVRLRAQSDRLAALDALRLFHVDRYRQPQIRLHVHAPAIEVEVLLVVVFALALGVGAVEADHVAVLIFNPHTAIEAAIALDLGMHVELPGAHAAQELAANVAENIMLLIEPDRIEEHHLREAVGVVSFLIQMQRLADAGKGASRALEEAVAASFRRERHTACR
jgi:hypothetical protein